MGSQSNSKKPNQNIHVNFPWYQVLKNPKSENLGSSEIKLDGDSYFILEQGDFLFGCKLIKPIRLNGSEMIVDSVEYDVIILTQSCDLLNKKVDLVSVSPIWPMSLLEQENPWYKASDAKEALRRGYQPSYHLLNQCDLENFRLDYMIVDFRQIFAVPFTQIINSFLNVRNRLRLLSPYKEHLSQAFARYFMRVGLPTDISPFSSKAKIDYT